MAPGDGERRGRRPVHRISRVRGSAFADDLRSSDAADVLLAMGGNDVLACGEAQTETFQAAARGESASRLHHSCRVPAVADGSIRAVAYYERSTRSTTLDGLPDPIRASMRAQAEASQITVAIDAPAFLTRSRRLRKPSLFERLMGIAGKDKEHLTALVLGAKDVLVATYAERGGTIVLAARLEDVEVGSTADRLAAEIGEDGVTVTGFPTSVSGTTGPGSYFVGLGSPDGPAARAALEDAVRRAKA
jgi:hypothetical protein